MCVCECSDSSSTLTISPDPLHHSLQCTKKSNCHYVLSKEETEK